MCELLFDEAALLGFLVVGFLALRVAPRSRIRFQPCAIEALSASKAHTVPARGHPAERFIDLPQLVFGATDLRVRRIDGDRGDGLIHHVVGFAGDAREGLGAFAGAQGADLDLKLISAFAQPAFEVREVFVWDAGDHAYRHAIVVPAADQARASWRGERIGLACREARQVAVAA